MIHDLFTWNHMSRINAVEYNVNQKIIETGRMPNGAKAKPARLEELRQRNEQIKPSLLADLQRKLRVGDIVTLSDKGLQSGLDGKHKRTTGIVKADEREDGTVSIHRFGDYPSHKQRANRYHSSYWKLEVG